MSRMVFSLVFVTAAIGFAGCGPGTSDDETVHLKVSGACASASDVHEFDMTEYAGTVSLIYPGVAAGASVPFPARGALDAAGHPIREGGWQLWGCLSGFEPCTDTFRRCTAVRVAWELDVTCLDGTGAPVCQAVLTE